MFNWTTTTIINSDKDFTTGKPLFTSITDAKGNKVFRVKRDHYFEAAHVEKVYRKEAEDPTLFELEIDCAEIISAFGTDAANFPAYGTLNFYIGLEGSEESIYANDWYQKGRPFSIGFEVKNSSVTATELAQQIIKNATKYAVTIFGKKIFEFLEENAGKLTIKGMEEHQRIKGVLITSDRGLFVETLMDYMDGEEPATGFELKERGTNGFGTYTQLLKDLRLPTAQHTKAYQILTDETPVIGAKYNQYIITYCAPSLAKPAFTTIGERNMSETTHIFWVRQDLDAAFKAVMEDALGAFAADSDTQVCADVPTTKDMQAAKKQDSENFTTVTPDLQPDVTTPEMDDTI